MSPETTCHLKLRLPLNEEKEDQEQCHPSQTNKIISTGQVQDLYLPSLFTLLRHLLNRPFQTRTTAMFLLTKIWQHALANHPPARASRVRDISRPKDSERFRIVEDQYHNSKKTPIPLTTTTINFLQTSGNARDQPVSSQSQDQETFPINEEDLTSTRYATSSCLLIQRINRILSLLLNVLLIVNAFMCHNSLFYSPVM